MRICIAGPKTCPPRIGGIEVFAYEVGRRLAASGVGVTVIVPRAPGLKNEEHLEGMQIVRIRAATSRFLLKISMIPNEILEGTRCRPDIFHANDPASGVAGTSRMGWRNCVLTVHGIGFSHSEWSTPFRQGGRILQKVAIAGADVTTTTDRRTASMLEDCSNTIRIIPPGVDTTLFSSADHQRPKSFEPDRINIIHVGRLTKVKGTDILIESLKLLSKDVRDAISLKVIGSGPLAPLVMEAERSSSSVEWIGEVPHDQIAPYFTNADILVMPSRSEGVPISMLEAMSCKVPVVSTIVGGIDTYFDERHLTKIGSPNAQSVADALESAVRNRTAATMKAAEAKALIDSIFSWDAVTNQYMKLYEEILS